MRIFGSERMKAIMQTLKMPEDMPVENKIISRSIEAAQKKVEGNNFDIRKHLVEYDDVINKHREVIYRRRREILLLAEKKTPTLSLKGGEDMVTVASLEDYILHLVEQEIEQVVTFHTGREGENTIKEVLETVQTIFPLTEFELKGYQEILATKNSEVYELRNAVIDYFSGLARQKFLAIKETYQLAPAGLTGFEQMELALLLRIIDNLWIEHLEAIDHLRRGIGLQGYGQRDPLVEYKKESYLLFSNLLADIQNQVVYNVFKLGPVVNLGGNNISDRPVSLSGASAQTQFATKQAGRQASEPPAKVKDASGHKVGRNDLCPCGSGKKYKKCCGK
jgi:preprotein translocase subunit SecA